ncbi:MAG: methionyl-tRNA formyltransferase [Patescibacteria group bacterium]|nr:methionyl-tRNA formyltransferase [Patescibacteria group bacterium]
MNPIRLIYFGTSEFAVPALRALLDRPELFDVAAVVSQPDRPAGRKGEMKTSPVAGVARELGLTLLQPESLKKGGAVDELKELDADVFVVAAYGQIIPKVILDIPKRGALNLHGSLLPKHRGASPIQTAILEGDGATGVTLMVMDEKMDHGPLLSKLVVEIDPEDDYPSLLDKLADSAAQLIVEDLLKFIAGELEAHEQDHDSATYTKILKKKDGLIDWTAEGAESMERRVRAFTPWPGTCTTLARKDGELRLKILWAEAVSKPEQGMKPGQIAVSKDGFPIIAAERGALKLLEVQPDGRRPMSGDAFLRGYPDILA